jgi:hypothetical protein
MPGYSATPLVKKLGFKAGDRVRVKNAPQNYAELIAPLPDSVMVSANLRRNIDIDHLFVTSQKMLAAQLPLSLKAIRQQGMIWVSWPKKASGVKTDMSEDVIRDIALPLGLVDIKVCAVDEVWSGLKLVIRKQLRR